MKNQIVFWILWIDPKNIKMLIRVKNFISLSSWIRFGNPPSKSFQSDANSKFICWNLQKVFQFVIFDWNITHLSNLSINWILLHQILFSHWRNLLEFLLKNFFLFWNRSVEIWIIFFYLNRYISKHFFKFIKLLFHGFINSLVDILIRSTFINNFHQLFRNYQNIVTEVRPFLLRA